MAKFKSKRVDLTLELTTQQVEGHPVETKTFNPSRVINAEYSEAVLKMVQAYVKDEQTKDEEDKESFVPGILRQLIWIYPDLEEHKEWVTTNFSKQEMNDMYQFVMQGINGLKKGNKS